MNAAEASEWPPRRRFTIGHELGHWYMHREMRDGVFCRQASIAADGGGIEPVAHAGPRAAAGSAATAEAAARPARGGRTSSPQRC